MQTNTLKEHYPNIMQLIEYKAETIFETITYIVHTLFVWVVAWVVGLGGSVVVSGGVEAGGGMRFLCGRCR